MSGLVARGWAWLRARLGAGQGRRIADGAPSNEAAAVSKRIRARYDTARKQQVVPTRQWLREHGVLDDWQDAGRLLDR
jgi:hypothetical protein